MSVEVMTLAHVGAPLHIRVITREKAPVVVQLVGELDLSNADAVVGVVDRQSETGRRFVRLDVSGLTFCDCAGLSAILRGYKMLLERRGMLTLTGVGPPVARLLSISHLGEALVLAGGPGGSSPVLRPHSPPQHDHA